MNDINNIWKETKLELSNILSATSFMVWINNIEPVCIKDNDLVLCAPSKNSRDTVEELYLEKIVFALNSLGVSFRNVIIITEEEKGFFVSPSDEALSAIQEVSEPKKPASTTFVARYTFDNFVVGECNKLAFRSAKTVAENPGLNDGRLNLNPLYIYGGVGLGKTHLLHAIGNFISETKPSLKIIYVPTETMTNEYFASLSNYSSDKDSYRRFREKYSTADVLMIDDVQFLQKKGGLQEVIFHIFNDLYQAGKQIILCSDRPPKEINDIEERLRTRFEWGMSADMYTPNFDTRIAIIIKKLELNRVNLADDIIYYLAENTNSNIRELEGDLNKVIMYSQLMNKLPSLALAKEALKVNKIENNNVLDSNKIIDSVCQYFRIAPNDIISKKKTKDIAEARMLAIYLIRELLDLPLVTIGQLFGGRDHSTIIYSYDKIRSTMDSNKKLSSQIKDIRNILNV